MGIHRGPGPQPPYATSSRKWGLRFSWKSEQSTNQIMRPGPKTVRCFYINLRMLPHPNKWKRKVHWYSPCQKKWSWWSLATAGGIIDHLNLYLNQMYTFFHKISWYLHSGRLTWNLQITHLERNMIFQTSMILFYVNLQGCRCHNATSFVFMDAPYGYLFEILGSNVFPVAPTWGTKHRFRQTPRLEPCPYNTWVNSGFIAPKVKL